jgi:two-component system sensor histidine kinase KdpD
MARRSTFMNRMESLPALENRAEHSWSRTLNDSLLAIAGVALITGILYWLHLYPRIPNISLVYLLVVLALASMRGFYAAILASVAAFLAYDFFLVPPLYTLTVSKFEEWLALFVFLFSAIITGRLASALGQRARQADRREQETRTLYDFVRAVNRGETVEQQLNIVARSIVDVFSAWGVRDCAILLPDTQGEKLSVQASAGRPIEQDELTPDEMAAASWVMQEGQMVELHDNLSPARRAGEREPQAIRRRFRQEARYYVRMIPLRIGQQTVGVLRLLQYPQNEVRLAGRRVPLLPPAHQQNPKLAINFAVRPEQERSAQQTTFFWTFVEQAATVIERARLRRESLQIELLKRTDELRAALLSSVSHDLRTPLSSIKASASSLLQEDVHWGEEERRSFALTIERESDRLNRLVENLLDMSRIEGGALHPEKEWYPIDELIHDVLGRMQPWLQKRAVQVELPDDLPPVQLDYMQIDQVLTNLIENAMHYSPEAEPIDISVQVSKEYMTVSVADRGPGIPPADRERVFDKFYRVLDKRSDTQRIAGSGLGLAVSRGLVEAHGGHIRVEDREGGGSVFRFTLPLTPAPVAKES